jgi:hypothetical protein
MARSPRSKSKASEPVSTEPEKPRSSPVSPPKAREAQVATEPPFDADERLERGLLAVAAFNGNTRRAAAFLAEDGFKINHQTLWAWANRIHLDRYEEIRVERLPRVQRAAAEQHMELATRNMELEGKLLDDLDEKRHELAARDISTAARNVAVGTGIHTEKSQLLNDQPTEIHKNRDASDVLRLLKARAPGLFIEGTVESEEDVEPALTDERTEQ